MSGPPQGGILGVLPIPIGLGGSLASAGPPAALHFWPMNEGSGSTLIDHIGTTNLIASNVTWNITTGLGATAVAQFNGTSSKAQASAVDSSLNFNGTQPMSISFWANMVVTSAGSFAGNLLAPTTYAGWEVTLAGFNDPAFLVVGNVSSNQMTAQAPSNVLAGSTPYFITVTYNGNLNLTGVTIYLNGVSQTLTDGSGTLTSGATSATPFIVGARTDNTNFIAGAIAYMRVWNQVITPSQISALYALGPQ